MGKNFWDSKTVLLTGHTGFKGSWLSIILKKFGANVIGFSKDIPTKPSMYEIVNVKEGMRSIIGDINDVNHLKQVFEDNKPQIVIHMAAQAIVRESYKNPSETFATNVMGVVNLLEAVRESEGVRVVIIVTSDKSYRIKKDHSKYFEDDAMGGYDPYSSSKGCAELITSSYRNSFFNTEKNLEHKVALASVRAGNVIGGGDWGTDRLLPDIMRGLENKSIIKIRNPDSVRPWQFVLDPLFGYLKLAEKMWSDGVKFSQGWNFGPTTDEEKTVRWITEFIKKQIEEETNFEMDTSSQPHEEKYLRLDCSKACEQLDWKSKMNLKNTLLWTINWYKEFTKGGNMKEITEKQIEQFLKNENE